MGKKKKEYGYAEFLERFAVSNDPNKPLEQQIVDYCTYIMEEHEDFDLWEFGKCNEIFNILCKNLACKCLAEKGYNISPCISMFSGVAQTYESLFKYDDETKGFKYIGK